MGREHNRGHQWSRVLQAGQNQPGKGGGEEFQLPYLVDHQEAPRQFLEGRRERPQDHLPEGRDLHGVAAHAVAAGARRAGEDDPWPAHDLGGKPGSLSALPDLLV